VCEARRHSCDSNLHMKALRAALDEHVAASVTPARYTADKEAAA